MCNRIVVPNLSMVSISNRPFTCEARSRILARPNWLYPTCKGINPRPLSRMSSWTWRFDYRVPDLLRWTLETYGDEQSVAYDGAWRPLWATIAAARRRSERHHGNEQQYCG